MEKPFGDKHRKLRRMHSKKIHSSSWISEICVIWLLLSDWDLLAIAYAHEVGHRGLTGTPLLRFCHTLCFWASKANGCQDVFSKMKPLGC